MKRQLKIIGTMIAVVIFSFAFFYALKVYTDIMTGIFIVGFSIIGLFIFYAGVASFFDED